MSFLPAPPRYVLEHLLKPHEWIPPEDRSFILDVNEIYELCDAAEEIFRNEPTVLRLSAPIKIFGDLHGQFGDLMRLFREYGTPCIEGDITYIDYLFLGGEHATCGAAAVAGRWPLATCRIFSTDENSPMPVPVPYDEVLLCKRFYYGRGFFIVGMTTRLCGNVCPLHLFSPSRTMEVIEVISSRFFPHTLPKIIFIILTLESK